MIFTEKTKRRFRNVVITLAVICITPLCEKGRMLSGAHTTEYFAGKDITCVIDLGNDIYGAHGLETGFNYELLSRFAQDNHCDIRIVAAGKNDNYIDSLRQGKVDIVVTHDKDSLTSQESDMLKTVSDCTVWAFDTEDEEAAMQLN